MTTSVLLVHVLLAAAVEVVTLDAGAWTVTSPADTLTAHEPVRRLVRALETDGAAILVIRHASGAADVSSAAALRAALVALGIPSARLRLEPVAAAPRSLILELAGTGTR